MAYIHFSNGKIVRGDKVLEHHGVIVSGQRILDIQPDTRFRADQYQGQDEFIDLHDGYLVPGFIDLHMHGVQNLLIDDGSEALGEICRILPQYGVTGFLPSITPGNDAASEIERFRQFSGRTYAGSEVLGFFLEGYYLALTGALTDVNRDLSPAYLQKMIDPLALYKAVFGISPEVPGIVDLLPLMTRSGTPAFITHTGATAEQTTRAIESGATHATHFYDVFPYPGEKDPGVRACGAVEAILAHERSSVDFILDGEHVDPIAVKLALRALGKDRVCLITDANAHAGLPPGDYTGINGREIYVAYEGAPARLGPGTSEPGALCGSGLTMDRAVRNAIKLLGVSLPLAVAMASANPARVLGLHDRKGQIDIGFDADLVWLDETLRVVGCWIGGRQYFRRAVSETGEKS